MNRLPLLFIGIFFTFACAWLGLVVIPYATLGRLQPEENELTGDILPPEPTGLAQQGMLVYAANGCVYCHTQQIRPKDQGADIARGWGKRRTVPRDYIRQKRVFLGSMRTGPDLTNVGVRLADPLWHHKHLYSPRSMASYSTMPAYRFLYRIQKIQGQGAPNALNLDPQDAPSAGYEVVPTQEAVALVAYLLSLKRDYDLKEVPQ